ncbi:hypothetical protein BJX99DRAFT_242929, partial [Aspergillus californicus]
MRVSSLCRRDALYFLYKHCERVSCPNPLYPLGLPPSDISICTMEATAPYLERPPKRKR